MNVFRYKLEIVGKTLNLAFEGTIDEDAVFPAVDTEQFDQMVIDLNEVRAINSIGIREWLAWLRPLSNQMELTFLRCPKSIILQFNMVDGFLPKSSKVISFYVPYVCEKCSYEGTHLFHADKDVRIIDKQVVLDFPAKQSANCEQGDCAIEIDVNESKYFQFLKNR